MNTELLKQKMREYFDNISPEELITKFEKMGYSFVDVTPQSEPLPDSGGNKAIQQLIKMIETRMSLVDSLDDATPSDRARYDVYVDMLAALKDASTVSEAGEDAIDLCNFAYIILSQYKCGNTNIEQPKLMMETAQLYKQSKQ